MADSLTTTYTIDLVVKDDNTRQAVDRIEKQFDDLGRSISDSIKSGNASVLDDVEKTTNEMIKSLQEGVTDASVDFNDVLKSYTSGAQRLTQSLQRQYASLAEQKKEIEDLESEREKLRISLQTEQSEEKRAQILARMGEISTKLSGMDKNALEAQIARNREIRRNLKAAEIEARYRQTAAKSEKALAKLRELEQKRARATNDEEKKALENQIKQQKLYLQSIVAAKKALRENTTEIERAIGKTGALTQATAGGNPGSAASGGGMLGGFGGMIGKAAIGAGVAVGAVTAAVSATSAAAQRQTELEASVNRINGIGGSDDDKSNTLKEMYYQTGADYGDIVEAINTVRKVIGKNASDSDVLSVAGLELRYPGMSQAFASTNTMYNIENAKIYAARQEEIQRATGASDEQQIAARQIISNLKPRNFNAATGTDLETIYLGLQNSGAFDSQDELDTAFRRFMSDQQASGKNIFDYAQDYTQRGKWSDRIHDQRNKLQADNTIKNIDFSTLKAAASTNDASLADQSQASKALMDTRRLEDMKNELLIKLIPVMQPIVEELSKLVQNKGFEDVISGLVELLKLVPTQLKPVFEGLNRLLSFLDTYVKPVVMDILPKISSFFDENPAAKFAAKMLLNPAGAFGAVGLEALNSLPQNASGGVSVMPSIVGERGPEAIIPLEYSRRQRAESIVNNISQNFELSGTETTALSLANAVKSRNFSRALSDSDFIRRRSL